MKTKFTVLLLCCAFGSGLKAQSSDQNNFLQLKTVDIVVEDLDHDPDAGKLGLTREDLESVALVALKSKAPKDKDKRKRQNCHVVRVHQRYGYLRGTRLCSKRRCLLGQASYDFERR